MNFVAVTDRVVVARLDHNTLQAQLKALPRTIYLTKWMKGKIKTELLIRSVNLLYSQHFICQVTLHNSLNCPTYKAMGVESSEII